ncbi:SusD/RagB family nutrient-binding outer membrane lipoprotein [Deminuibacter soli]|nr:SusD/RagB family nutrient-binding outer membrane lipoprotein [Deminuibacter soli]
MTIIKKIYSSLVFVGMLAGAVSCKKELDKNLQNPNGVPSKDIKGKDVFPSALNNTAAMILGQAVYSTGTATAAFASEWMGYTARTTSYSASGAQLQIELFTLNSTYSNGLWEGQYHNIFDYNFVIANSDATSVLSGAAKVMRALVFEDLVDIYGNIPYKQAVDPSGNIRPAYDTDSTIYRSLITDLDSAIISLKASQSGADDAADVLFKGDKTKWVQFANTIKMRILIRQSVNGDQTYIKQQFTAIQTEGSGFLSQEAGVNPGYTDAVNQQSPLWNNYGFEVGGKNGKANHVFYIANKTMTDYLAARADPRLGRLYAESPSGVYDGNFLGDGVSARPVATLSTFGPGVLQSAAMDAVLMSASQSYLLQAEAAYKGYITGDYISLFRKGVEESFRYLGVPGGATAADAYIDGSADDRINIAASANPVKTIIYQKWIALCEMDGLEAWAEWRRTGFPDRTKPSLNPSVATNVIPERLLYPQTEFDNNTANVAMQKQTSADKYKAIFWSK